MLESLRAIALRWLRVPADPEPPPGDPGSLRVFRASPRFFTYRCVIWALRQVGALAGLAFGYFFIRTFVTRGERTSPFLLLGETAAWTAFLAQLPFSFMVMRLDFELRWYILTDRSLRIREGILQVREQTLTFANIQNLEIRQNPLERLFGLSNVAVRAAGGGGGGPQGARGRPGRNAHEARFEGVDNAEEIRTAIRKRIRAYRDTGLGDPDETRGRPTSVRPAARVADAAGGPTLIGAADGWSPEGRAALDAAARLLDETRRLRQQFAEENR